MQGIVAAIDSPSPTVLAMRVAADVEWSAWRTRTALAGHGAAPLREQRTSGLLMDRLAGEGGRGGFAYRCFAHHSRQADASSAKS
jgi:hypothetical protein